MRYGHKYATVALITDLNPQTISKWVLYGRALFEKYINSYYSSNQYWNIDKLLSTNLNEYKYIYGESFLKRINIICDGMDLKCSSPNDYSINSWTYSHKTKMSSVRLVLYVALDGQCVMVVPKETSCVTGRHNDSGLMDFITCSNVDDINSVIIPSMFKLY